MEKVADIFFHEACEIKEMFGKCRMWKEKWLPFLTINKNKGQLATFQLLVFIQFFGKSSKEKFQSIS